MANYYIGFGHSAYAVYSEVLDPTSSFGLRRTSSLCI